MAGRLRRLVSIGLMTLVFAPAVHAAEALMEEITITAQKRAQPLQDVGIAVTAFTGEQIKDLGFQNSIDIVAHTPGMTFGTPTAEGNNANIALRGVALNDFNDNNESPVAVYVDEVYVSAIAGATFQLFDIDRVEVLRGPQGTLFGRNASGGLAQFITVAPKDEYGGYADVTFAEHNQIKSELALNVPLTDSVAARLSVAQNKYDGYVHNRQPGINNPNDAESEAGRLQLLFDVDEDLSVLLKIHGNRLDNRDGSWQHQSTQSGGGAHGDVNIPLPADVENPNPAFAGVGPGNDIFGYRDTDHDPWAGDYDRDGPLKVENYGYAAHVKYQIDPDLEFTSITAWDKYSRMFGEDTDVGPTPGIVPTFDSDIEQWTQEFRLAGSSERMHWVAGFFYFNSDVNGIVDLGAFALTPTAPLCRVGPCVPPATDWPIFYNGRYDQSTESWATFGQIEYDLSQAFTLIGGLRYTDERRDLWFFAQDLVDPSLIYMDFTRASVGNLTRNDTDNVTGKVELDWHAAEKVLVYGYVSRGAKSAGFNTGLLDENGIFNSVTPKQVPFNQETLTAYEMGVKSEFADGLVRLNVAAYYYDYTNFQAFAFQNLGQLIFNTDATVNGGEMELTLSPTDRFEASFGVGWIHEAEAQDIPSYTGRIRDRRMVLAPEYQLNTILRYTVPLPRGANITAQWDGFYQTKTYFDIQNYPISQSDDYQVWNARLIYNSPDDKWTVTAWVNNVFDEEYLQYSFDFTNSFGFNQLGYGRPRWVGASVGYKW
jgi:iron complex outermembrane receptor protein